MQPHLDCLFSTYIGKGRAATDIVRRRHLQISSEPVFFSDGENR